MKKGKKFKKMCLTCATTRKKKLKKPQQAHASDRLICAHVVK